VTLADHMREAATALICAPFVAFCLILIVATIATVAWLEKR
jgi:hypothetical protein